MLGDVIQLGRTEDGYYHTLLIVGFADNTYLVAAQSDDAYERPLDTYNYDYARFIHIEGVRFDAIDSGECFIPLLAGEALLIGGRVVRENSSVTEPPSEENVPAEPSTPEMPLPTPSLPPEAYTPPSSAEAP
jgi:hypothetical protein